MASKNPFMLDDDVDDDAFVNHRSRNYDSAEARLYEQKHQQILEERRQIENRMLQSSNSAVQAIYETEQIGMSAAEELVRQGEQLRKVDGNLDDINNTMKSSQKHLTAMKSMFSGFRGIFGRSNTTPAADSVTSPTSPQGDLPQGKLGQALNQVKGDAETARTNNHPALRNRMDTSGFGAAFDDDDAGVAMSGGSRYGGGAIGGQGQQLTRSQMVDRKLDNDLSELSAGVGRLKTLAHGLGAELDDQLDLLNNINDKTDQAEGTIKFQTGQMNRLLKK